MDPRFHGVAIEPALERLFGQVPASASLHRLPGDASTRAYYRLDVPDAEDRAPKSAIVMHLPEDALKSDELGGGAPKELPFLAVQKLLASRGVPVPRTWVADVPNRVVILEDLGDETFAARLSKTPESAWPDLYGRAVDLLASMHEACREQESHLVYERRFDRALLRWELDHFREWGVEAVHGPLDPNDRADLDRRFDALADTLAAAPTGFVHRDYQSRNLMWVDGRDAGDLVVIDFQDALVGPVPYDLVALLCDSYVTLTKDFQRSMITKYCASRGIEGADAKNFETTFWMLAVQRKLKDAGRFVFIDRVRKNPGFLKNYPASLRYVGRALGEVAGLDGLDRLLARLVPGFPDGAPVPNAVSR